jgi:hypothetical protein
MSRVVGFEQVLSLLRRVLVPISLLLLLAPLAATGCEDTEPDPNACVVNADCVDSPEADRFRYVRCIGNAVVCLGGQCLGTCGKTCQPVVATVNPCEGGAFCVPASSTCSLVRIACATAGDCPVYRPSDAPASFAWTCDDGFCAAPGVAYATH